MSNEVTSIIFHTLIKNSSVKVHIYTTKCTKYFIFISFRLSKKKTIERKRKKSKLLAIMSQLSSEVDFNYLDNGGQVAKNYANIFRMRVRLK